MEKNNIASNESKEVSKEPEFNLNNIPRCIKCNLICSLKLNYVGNLEPRIIYECENGHYGDISLQEYMKKYNNFAISKEKCFDCGKNQNEKRENYFYCSKCYIFICSSCQLNHYGHKHSISSIKRYDSLCSKHSNLFCSYCSSCKKNLCVYCQNYHRNHEILNLSEIKYSEKTKLRLEEEMSNIEKIIRDLDEIKEIVVSEINKLKDYTNLEIEFIKILIKSYEYEENLKNLNFNVIQNLKNLDKAFRASKIKVYEKLNKDGSNYMSILQNLNNIKSTFQNNFKIIKEHNHYINYISKLIDGRLVSCSRDNSLNVYKKDSYELQMSIKEHNNSVYCFTELIDGRLISCSEDKTMKIIKLLEDDKYQIDQTLEGHTYAIYKVIEIKENELISISYDKTMKIWKLDNENKFECILSIVFQNSNSYCNIYKINEYEF